MSFEGAPHFLVGQEIRAKRATRSGEVRVAAAGNASLFVPDGHWVFVEDGNAFELPDADFRARFVAVPPDERSFVERGRAVRAVFSDDAVRLEGRDAMSEADFTRLAVRARPDGSPICRMAMPSWRQAEAVIASGEPGRLHLEAMRTRRRALRGRVLFDPELASELHLLDAVLDPLEDKVSDGMASLYAARPPEGLTIVGQSEEGTLVSVDPAALRGILMLRGGIPPALVIDVARSPIYLNQGLRAFTRAMLSPYLGDHALEDAVLVPVPVSEIGDEIRSRLERLLDDEAELIVQGPPASSPNMPGYETSPMRHYRLRDEGVEVCTFSDAHGFYVYAWKAPRPEPAPKV